MYNKDKFFAKRQILRSGVIFQWKSKLHYWIKSAKKIKYFLNYVCTHYLSTTFEKRQNQFILASMDTQCTSIRITTHSCLHLLGWQSTKYILYFLEKFVRNLTKRIGKQYWHWSILKNKIMAAWRSWCNVNIEQMYCTIYHCHYSIMSAMCSSLEFYTPWNYCHWNSSLPQTFSNYIK